MNNESTNQEVSPPAAVPSTTDILPATTVSPVADGPSHADVPTINAIPATKPPPFTPHPLQMLYRGPSRTESMYDTYKCLIRALFIRPKNDVDDQVYVCSDDERCRLATMFAYEASCNSQYNSGDYSKTLRLMLGKLDKGVAEFLDLFMLRSLLLTGRCFVAGGAVLRFVLNEFAKESGKSAELASMFTTSDIDVFFTDDADINTYMYYLASKNVVLDKIADKHDTYRVSSVTGAFAHPFLIQFTKISATSIHELLDDFDLPMCQIGIGKRLALEWTLGFEVLMEHMNDAVIHVTAYNNDAEQRKDYIARVAKFEAMGYRFKFVNDRTYYGRRPWTMDYYERKALALSPSPANTPLLLTLMERHNARINYAHLLYLGGVAAKEIAKKAQYEQEFIGAAPDEEAKAIVKRVLYHNVVTLMLENAKAAFLYTNAFSLHGNEKNAQIEAWRRQFYALYEDDKQERMKNADSIRQIKPGDAEPIAPISAADRIEPVD